METASIIVVTRNRKKQLKLCLNSLKILDSSYEIIVVDNASTDSSVHYLKRLKNIKLIANEVNNGVAKARNQGVYTSSGKYIIFIDDDVQIKQRNTISEIIKLMDKDKNIGVVGPKILYPNGKLQESARSFPKLGAIFWRGTGLFKLFPGVKFYQDYILSNIKSNEISEVDWVIGAFQVTRKSIFNKVGLLDENYFFYYQDIDFCKRVKQMGYKIIYYPMTFVNHNYQRESTKKILNTAKIHHARAIFRYFFIKKDSR